MSDTLKVGRRYDEGRGGSRDGQAGPIKTILAYNNSGGTLNLGDVVILDRANSTADFYYVKTTTTVDHPDVLGMVYDGSIASATVGHIQTWGPTKYLKVNGTTDIAVKDLLGTHSVAKIAAKTYGPNAFAVALEAYTTNDSSGVIDAFLLGNGRIPGLITGSGGPDNRLEKIAKVALTAGTDTGGGIFAWANPEEASIIVTRVEIDRTTAATSACTVDIGTTATSSTTSSDNLIDGLNANATADLESNLKNGGTNGKADQKLASGEWVTGSTNGGASAGLVGSAYIHYVIV